MRAGRLRLRPAYCLGAALVLVAGEVPTHAAAPSAWEAAAKGILAATGVKGGLVIHMGCGNGRMTAALRANDSYLVQGIDADAANVEKAREHIQSLGLYGQVSVDQMRGTQLPYVDNLVNLLVGEKLGGVPMEEVMRVLAPKGVAYVKENGKWVKTVKPWPEEIDEWTHFLHGADNNAVARDTRIGPPGRVQWTAGPRWSRDHDNTPSVFAPVSANGRLFYVLEDGPVCVIDERLPEKRSLVARDAFNGAILWKRKMSDWYSSRLIWGHIPVSSQRRLVAIGDRVYATLGLQSAVTALDAATGATALEYTGTERTSEIVCDEGILVLVIRKVHALEGVLASRDHRRFTKGYQGPERGGEALMAVRADTGERLWRNERHCLPSTLAVSGGRVFFVEDQQAVCLDLESGRELWKEPCPARTLVVHEGVVLLATGHDAVGSYRKRGGSIKIKALSAHDGKCLWTAEGGPLPNFYYFFFAPADVFVARGLVWALTEDFDCYKKPGSGHMLGLDLATGKVKKRIPLTGAFTPGHHVRCYKSKATERFLLFNKRGIEFLDIESGRRPVQCHWVRGACRYGILPCNGLLYAPSHACVCYPGAKLNGFYALAPAGQASATIRQSSEARLERGPAYGRTAVPQSEARNAQSRDWPAYRHDARRSGSTPTTVLPNVRPVWRVDMGGKLSAPVVADGRVYLARVDKHAVDCLDAVSGKTLWSYTAGGRVDSPPAIYRDVVIFGCRDGWVYCVKSPGGALVWRFRAAPAQRLVGAFGQLESAWPVHGSVLVREGIAYFAAGRSSFLDGGIRVYGLDVMSGKLLFETILTELAPAAAAAGTSVVRVPGALPDILTSDGKHLYMQHVQLANDLSNKIDAATLSWGVKSDSHLLPGFGFLDGTLFNRTVWKYGHRIDRSQLLALDGTDVYGLRVYWGLSWNCAVFNPGEGYVLFRQDVAGPVHRALTRKKLPGSIPYERYTWHKRVPVRVCAMALTGTSDVPPTGDIAVSHKCLFAAGTPDEIPTDDPLAAFEGRRGARLLVLSAEDGETLHECRLDSPPVWDGMAAANGRLYIATKAGNLLCMEGKEWKWKRRRIARKREPEKLVTPGGLIFSASLDKNLDADKSKGIGKADSKGVTLENGALMGRGAKLTYATKANFNLSRGSVEFRVCPQASLADRRNHKLFCIGKQEHPNAFQCWKTGAFNDLRLRIYDSNKKPREVVWKGIDGWKVGSWHHILFSWDLDAGRLSLWVDRVNAGSCFGDPINVSELRERMWIGTEDGGGQEAMAIMDDLKIYEQEPPQPPPPQNRTR